jgi:peptide/nickel transport system ATP-binding protein
MWFRGEAQIIFQDPLSSLSPRLKMRQLLAEPLRIHGCDVRKEFPRVLDLMASVNLPTALLEKYPHQVSGGQARRIGIARALVLNPRLVIADEPTAGLDVSIQGDLLNLVAGLQEEFGLTYLIVSHNLNVVRKVTDRVAVMYLGQIVEIGRTATVFHEPAHPYSHALISANPEIDPAKRREKIVLSGEIPSPLDPPSGCRFHTRCPRMQERCRIEEPKLRPMGSERSAACHFPLVPA